jgi:flagellin
MRINHNIAALNAYSKLAQNQIATGKVLERLSSGLRINRAADDAAGLAISEKMRGQIRGLQQAERNTMDGISLIQTAEGALSEVHSMLQRMRELAVQAANDTYNTTDRTAASDEVKQLMDAIDDIAKTTKFNDIPLISSTPTPTTVNIQDGSESGEQLSIDLTKTKSDIATLGLTGIDATIKTDSSSATGAIDTIQTAIGIVSDIRSYLGAMQNRLEHVSNNLGNYSENITAAESRIRDADMAKEMTEFTKLNIINQSATAMLAQANQLPQGVLQLLKG